MGKLGRPRIIPDVDCAQCGERFHPATRRVKFCSRGCYFKWKVGQPGARIKPTVKRCVVCGGKFEVGGAGRPRRQQTHCSAACAGRQKEGPPRKLSAPEAAWLAGLFDGEGSVVNVKRASGRYSLRISISNTYLPLLEQVVHVAGVGKIINHRPATDRHARSYYWACYSRNACELLEQMLPWLLVKREKATAAIARGQAGVVVGRPRR